ncbi:MAG TPA: hypothetical protein VGP43_01830 [Chitinophagaceae bacterium]|nr:hypothetical protein [Chitinophagaceae bacterium]
MKTKYTLITAIALLLVANVFAQDIVGLLINGKKIGERTVKDRPAIIHINKMKYKNISSITITVKQAQRYSVYKRAIEITNEKEDNLYLVNESLSKKEEYQVNVAAIRLTILKQKVIKVFLAENPANVMMKLPSRRKLLAELYLR